MIWRYSIYCGRKKDIMSKGILYSANRSKNDEFYTQLSDIENELKHYKEQFRNKVVFLNCDDPFESNFFKYFASNFNHLRLKKLIATSYTKSPIAGTQLDLFEVEGLKPSGKQPFKIEINEVPDVDGDGAINISDVEYLLKHDKNIATPLIGNGDFRSEECIELLKQSDIVCTNPPFSLFREYVAQLVECKKEFLIIGNTNALTYKEIFKLVQDNKLRTGYTNFNVGMYFVVPDDWEKYHHIDESGKKIARVSTSCWFTSFDVAKHHDKITLYKKYSPEEYPNYYNYNAIEVSKVSDIPMDYEGEMGVPITFIDKFNPDQFEIIGKGVQLEKTIRFTGDKATLWIEKDGKPWKAPFERIVIKNKLLEK